MKSIFMFIAFLVTSPIVAANLSSCLTYSDFPVKTIIFKDPAADNLNAFFSGSTHYRMWIYKAGSSEDLNKIIDSIKKDASVKSCTSEGSTGDYTEIVIVLSASKDKSWFVSRFKAAGINNIKINNNAVVPTEKL